MSPPDGYNKRLITGFCQLLADEGLGNYVTTGVYPADGWAFFVGKLPDQPDRAVAVMTYPVEDTDLTSVITGLQFRYRGGPDANEVENMSDAVYDLLHMRSHYVVNGIPINLSWRQSGAWLGQDANRRVERTENFYLRAERESTHLIP